MRLEGSTQLPILLRDTTLTHLSPILGRSCEHLVEERRVAERQATFGVNSDNVHAVSHLLTGAASQSVAMMALGWRTSPQWIG